jgi:hypothetical protein
MPRCLEVLARGGEVAVALADGVDMQAVEAGGQDACRRGLDRDRGVATAEVDGCIRNVFSVGGVELCGQLLRV